MPEQRLRPCLVMLPGTWCDRRIFRLQCRALRPVAHVVTPDASGIREVRPWLHNLLLRLRPCLSLAGFSLGGLWARELLRLAPHRIERLAMIGSHAEAASPRAHRRGRHYRRRWHSQGPAAVARQVKPMYFHLPAQGRRHAASIRAMAPATSARAARAQFDWAAARTGGLAAWSRFTGPALIVSGANDRLCPPPLRRRLARANLRARWRALSGCGHFIPLEQPAALAGLLHHWLMTPLAALATPTTSTTFNAPT